MVHVFFESQETTSSPSIKIQSLANKPPSLYLLPSLYENMLSKQKDYYYSIYHSLLWPSSTLKFLLYLYNASYLDCLCIYSIRQEHMLCFLHYMPLIKNSIILSHSNWEIKYPTIFTNFTLGSKCVEAAI